MLLGTISSVNTVSLISHITSTIGIMIAIEPTSGVPSNGKLAILYKLLVLCIFR